MRNAGLDEAQAGIKIAGRNVKTSDMQMTPPLWQKAKRTWESEKAGLKLNIQKAKIVASGPLTSWQIDGETVETVTDFIFCLQNHCGWWLQPWNLKTLAPWKKSYDKPRQHIKKQRHCFADKGLYSQRYDFSSNHIQMWELDRKQGWGPENSCFWIMVL